MRKKPESLALAVSLAGMLTVLTFFLADLLLSRHNDLETGERRLNHFAIMMAEHTARSFEAVDVLLRETANDLNNRNSGWDSWAPAQGYEYIAQRHSRAMPQLRELIVFDRLGNQRFISTRFPSPSVNVRDRPYFTATEAGAEAASFGPYVGRNSGRYTYGIARRLHNDDGRFAGIVFGNLEPAYLQDFCWANRLAADFEAVLANTNDEIIASCRPTDTSRQSPILGAKASEVLFDGKLQGRIPDNGLTSRNGLLVVVLPVPGFSDLRILAAIPERALLAEWYSRFFELGTLALLVTVVLFVGALMIRRQVRDMASMTSELASSHEYLEERIHDATVELAGQKDAAERANAAKSRFLAAASHDLRQPLHALSLFAADLQRQVAQGTHDTLPRLAEQIEASTAVLGQMLDSLLDISRLDVAGIKPDRRHFALQPSFVRIAESFRRAAADRRITLRFRPTAHWVETDQLLLERMIANLVSNALRYTTAGGRVLVAARRRGDKVVIEVRDSGIGIAPEHQAAIFAEFYQVGNTAREQNQGLGLGLSIVDRLSRALNIEVTLRSRVGEGTTFGLKVAASSPVAASVAPADQPPAAKVHCVGRSDELRSCIRLLENWDFSVSTTDHASDQRAPEDALLIVDADQAEAVSNELAAHQPLIVLVGDPAPPLPAGAHALPLPVRPAKLRALVNQLQKTLSKSTP